MDDGARGGVGSGDDDGASVVAGSVASHVSKRSRDDLSSSGPGEDEDDAWPSDDTQRAEAASAAPRTAAAASRAALPAAKRPRITGHAPLVNVPLAARRAPQPQRSQSATRTASVPPRPSNQ